MWVNSLREEETKTTFIVLELTFQYLTPTPVPQAERYSLSHEWKLMFS